MILGVQNLVKTFETRGWCKWFFLTPWWCGLVLNIVNSKQVKSKG